MFATKRLGKELQKARTKLPPGISIAKADDFREWQMDIRVLDDNPIYRGEIYRLSFIFSQQYPIDVPEVTFIKVPACAQQPAPNSANQPIDLTSDEAAPVLTQSIDTGYRPIPFHPHIYSNGIICLDLLSSAGWSPVQSVETVCVSIQSMLTGNTKHVRPEGDEAFCKSMGTRGPNGFAGGGRGMSRGLRDVRFAYDDDKV